MAHLSHCTSSNILYSPRILDQLTNISIPRAAERNTRSWGTLDDMRGGDADGDAVYPTFNGGNYFLFEIPNSHTNISLYLASNVGPALSQKTLLDSVRNFTVAQLAASGDGQLPQSVDPFVYDLQQGIYLNVSSVKGQHLTWGIFNVAAQWLYKHMGEANQYHHPGSFWIIDSDWGSVAMGSTTFGYTNSQLPQVIQGPAGVTNYSS